MLINVFNVTLKRTLHKIHKNIYTLNDILYINNSHNF